MSWIIVTMFRRLRRIILLGIAIVFAFPGVGRGVTAPSSIEGMTLSISRYFGIGGSMNSSYVMGSNGSMYVLYEYHVPRGESFSTDSLVNSSFEVPGTYTYQPNGDATATLTVNGILTYNYNLTFSSPTGGSVSDGSFSLSPLSGGGMLANVSSRSLVSPTTPCIAGFIVTGYAPRFYLIRVAGPTLTQYGVTAAVPNPTLQLFKGSSLLAENDDWESPATRVDSLKQAVLKTSAFPFLSGSKDAAIVVLLFPGVYTAMGRSSQSGELLVEVYLVP